MREHQIVITLKPDQFLEVQRLARAANSKSMGIFVRQQLLAALGIEGASSVSGQDGAQDIENAVSQIKRLHSELKTFVAESLSLYNVDSSEEAGAMEQGEAAAAPVVVDDGLESVAERTFAISPRLGPIGQEQPRDGQRGDSAPAQDPLDKLLPKGDEFKPVELPAGEAPTWRYGAALEDLQIPPSLAERQRQMTQAAAEPEPAAQEVPEQALPEPPAQTQPSQTSSNRISGSPPPKRRQP